MSPLASKLPEQTKLCSESQPQAAVAHEAGLPSSLATSEVALAALEAIEAASLHLAFPRLQRGFRVGTSVPLKLPCQAIQQPSWKSLQSNSRVVEEPLQLSDPLELDYQPNPIGPSSGRSCSSSQSTTAAHPPGCSATMNALFRLLLLALSQNVGCETNYKCTIHKLPYLCPSLPVTSRNLSVSLLPVGQTRLPAPFPANMPTFGDQQ